MTIQKIRRRSKDEVSLSKSIYIIEGQIRWAVEKEMAMTLEDVLARRTRILFLDAKEAIRIAPEVASIMAGYMNKDQDWIDQQLIQFRQIAENYLVGKS